MNLQFSTIILFNLIFINAIGQDNSSFLNNCKEINFEEFSELRKENPNIKISNVLENGKLLNKKKYDSITSLSKIHNIKRVGYQDTINNKILIVNKIISESEIKQIEKKRKEELKEDKVLRKELNGTIIKELELTDLNNEKYNLENLKGKVIVLNFWFTQCKPCVAEFPDLNNLRDEFKDKPVEFFAVTFNKKQTLEKFFKNHNLNYKIIPNGTPIIDKFKIPYFPFNLIIDKNGKVEYISDVLALNIFKKLKRKINNLL